MPLARRIPKRGFHNIFKKKFTVINLYVLNRFPSGALVTLETLREAGLVSGREHQVKLLGHGTLNHPLTIKLDHLSGKAKEKILAAGGSVQEGA
jgi:large subunit ribosomal protein L15